MTRCFTLKFTWEWIGSMVHRFIAVLLRNVVVVCCFQAQPTYEPCWPHTFTYGKKEDEPTVTERSPFAGHLFADATEGLGRDAEEGCDLVLRKLFCLHGIGLQKRQVAFFRRGAECFVDAPVRGDVIAF